VCKFRFFACFHHAETDRNWKSCVGQIHACCNFRYYYRKLSCVVMDCVSCSVFYSSVVDDVVGSCCQTGKLLNISVENSTALQRGWCLPALQHVFPLSCLFWAAQTMLVNRVNKYYKFIPQSLSIHSISEVVFVMSSSGSRNVLCSWKLWTISWRNFTPVSKHWFCIAVVCPRVCVSVCVWLYL